MQRNVFHFVTWYRISLFSWIFFKWKIIVRSIRKSKIHFFEKWSIFVYTDTWKWYLIKGNYIGVIQGLILMCNCNSPGQESLIWLQNSQLIRTLDPAHKLSHLLISVQALRLDKHNLYQCSHLDSDSAHWPMDWVKQNLLLYQELFVYFREKMFLVHCH